MAIIIYSMATALLSKDAISALGRKGSCAAAKILLDIEKIVTVKKMSEVNEGLIEIKGEWDAVRQVHDILQRACTSSESRQDESTSLAQNIGISPISEDHDHTKKDSSFSQVQVLPLNSPNVGKSAETSYNNSPNSPKELATSSLFQEVVPPTDLLFPLDEVRKNDDKNLPFEEVPSLEADETCSNFKCQFCEYKSKRKSVLADHVKRIHGPADFHCTQCNAAYKLQKDLNRHMKSTHDDDFKVREPLKCTQCSFTTDGQKALTDHMRRSHRERNHECGTCRKKFAFERDLVRHRKIHEGPNFTCTVCPKSYSTKWFLNEHMKTHNSAYVKPRFQCEDCGSLFSSKQNLTMHKTAAHTEERREYQCEVCNQVFLQKRSLQMHVKKHTETGNYECNVCQKKFQEKDNLMKHSISHSASAFQPTASCANEHTANQKSGNPRKQVASNNKFVCNVCSKSFSQSQALKRHERKHTGARPYACELCDKTFSDKSVLRRHKLALHKSGPLKQTGETHQKGCGTEIINSPKVAPESSGSRSNTMTESVPHELITTIHDICVQHDPQNMSISDLGLCLSQPGGAGGQSLSPVLSSMSSAVVSHKICSEAGTKTDS